MIQANESQVWQILYEDRHHLPCLHSWYETKEKAEEMLTDLRKCFPKAEYSLEQGTDHINDKCRGCETIYTQERHDHYGNSTGYYCDECYENNYPYRKDAYFDPDFAGERMDDDY